MSSASFDRTESLLNASELKKRYFHGVTIQDENGNEIDDSVIETFINQAISTLEVELDINIYPKKYVERRDFHRVDYQNWSYLKLHHFPVLSVDAWKAQYPVNTDLITYPTEWYRIYPESGEVQLVPTAGSIATFFLPGGSVLPYVLGSKHIPQFFEIEYTAGFEADCIPYVINKAIGLMAAIDLFHIAGDLVGGGAGIANYSISVDGLSQSVGTTSSATNAGYGARILGYEKQLTSTMKTLKLYYKGINMVVG